LRFINSVTILKIISPDNHGERYLLQARFVDKRLIKSRYGVDKMARKTENSRIKIPKLLISEVDRIVEESGLYSDEAEFVTDAVRRLIIESKKEEVKRITYGQDSIVKSKVNMKDVKHKGSMEGPPQS
jgi:Arc/MetJ-type ribon-helix-helix transcriptional regulator